VRQPYKPVIPMMVIRATADELIALGWVVTHYLQYLERSAQKTQEHRELIALLHSFQERVLQHSAYQREGQQ
jgi:hypothetical protein